MSWKCAAGVALAMLISSGFLVSNLEGGGPGEHTRPAPSKAQPAMDRLKTLEGEWVYADGENAGKPAVRYIVSSGGTAVIETIFVGTPNEMVTVYHLDGDRIMMTHYCAVGNQPQMHAEPAEGKLVFTCSGGSNMKEEDGHMHAMTMTLNDSDHLKEDWTWKDKDKTGTETFSFTRKR